MSNPTDEEIRRLRLLVTDLADQVGTRIASYSDDDILDAYKSIRSLGEGGECDYDLPAVGPLYSLVFHAKRFQEALFFIDQSRSTLQDFGTVSIVDYGAGTGAATWAIQLRHAQRKIAVQFADCIEPSARMRSEGQALWEGLPARCRDRVAPIAWHDREPHHLHDSDNAARVLVGSYFVSRSFLNGGRREVESCIDAAERWNCRAAIVWMPRTKIKSEQIMDVVGQRGWELQEPDEAEFRNWFPAAHFPEAHAEQIIVGLCGKRGVVAPGSLPSELDLADILGFEPQGESQEPLAELLAWLERDGGSGRLSWSCKTPDRCSFACLRRG